MPLTLHRCVLDWYHLYLNHHGETRLSNTIHNVLYCKGFLTQVELSIKTCKKCQQIKKISILYGQIPPNIIAALKPWNLLYIYLIGPYSKSKRQQDQVGAIIKNYVILNCMTIIDPATCWFKKFEVPCFDLNEVA